VFFPRFQEFQNPVDVASKIVDSLSMSCDPLTMFAEQGHLDHCSLQSRCLLLLIRPKMAVHLDVGPNHEQITPETTEPIFYVLPVEQFVRGETTMRSARRSVALVTAFSRSGRELIAGSISRCTREPPGKAETTAKFPRLADSLPHPTEPSI
jgi:hypothetical protein